MWLDVPEFTNHTSSELEVLVGLEVINEFVVCLITNILPQSLWSKEKMLM